MEGEEGDAERQREMELRELKPQARIGEGGEEARIFEDTEDREVEGDRGGDEERRRRCGRSRN
jgi:hypothetical protein